MALLQTPVAFDGGLKLTFGWFDGRQMALDLLRDLRQHIGMAGGDVEALSRVVFQIE
jgi:hypothetical protein